MSSPVASGDRHHYVSKFHLGAFVDPNTADGQEPSLWVGEIASGKIRRRAPKNVAWERGLFSGPGGLAQRDGRLEHWLATQVEAPAAAALREFVSLPVGQPVRALPRAIARYVAWAAARALPMRGLYERWIAEAGSLRARDLADAESSEASAVARGTSMEHFVHGALHGVPPELVGKLQEQGWQVRLTPADFLELTHLQSWEFQSRWFPKLHWHLLWAPTGRSFVLGDRPVAWQADGILNAPPAALADATAQLVAPLAPAVALLGSAAERRNAPGITPEYVNLISAGSAHSFIFGATRDSVADTLALLKEGAQPAGRVGE